LKSGQYFLTILKQSGKETISLTKIDWKGQKTASLVSFEGQTASLKDLKEVTNY
jgi:hypothetical protein